MPLLLPFLIVWIVSFTHCRAQMDFSAADNIVRSIQLTSFPADTFVITQYGAKAEVSFDSRPAIEKAIEACHNQGGGVVLISKGTFFSKGPISLKSNVNVKLELIYHKVLSITK